ncbi:uncharacterized protein PHACADRAFT_108883, partial [Phanerochaete carnosa HHB-10118-sp]
PAEWYKRLTKYLTLQECEIELRAKMKAGVEPLGDVLPNLFARLSVLYDVTHEQDLKPGRKEVMAELCN